MTRIQYLALNLASLAVAALIACEMVMVHQLDHVATLVERAQAPLAQAREAEPQVRALVQRTAVGATRDPALKDLLFKYGIVVKIKPTPENATDPTTVAPGAQMSSAAPATPATP